MSAHDVTNTMLYLFASWLLAICATGLGSTHAQTSNNMQGIPLNTTEEIEWLIATGPRLTGTERQNNLIDRIESFLTSWGLEVQSDHLTFDYRTEPSNLSLVVDGQRKDVSSFYPYSGVTHYQGLTARLVEVPGTLRPDWEKATGAIAVRRVSNPLIVIPFSPAMWFPGDQPLIKSYRHPMLATDTLKLDDAKTAGVKGVVYVWDGSLTPANAKGQYSPFKMEANDVPAIFVAGDTGHDVLSAASAKSEATITMDQDSIPGTNTRTIYTIIEGTDSEKKGEVILYVTHTDGTNVIEENGHIALMQLAQDLAVNPPKRTHIFAFVTGHFRMPSFTKEGKATTRWLNDHKDLWQRGSRRGAVAAVVVEHLGAAHYVDDIKRQTYQRGEGYELEFMYASTLHLATIARRQWRDGQKDGSALLHAIHLAEFGEIKAFDSTGIPYFGIITAPPYILAQWAGDEHDLVDMDCLNRQVGNLQRISQDLDAMYQPPV